MALLKFVSYIPFSDKLIRLFFDYKDPKLEREVFGIKFKNPVGLAAGFDKNAEVCNELSCLGFGFLEVGTITPKGQPGNPKPRLFRLIGDQAIINRMGFNNLGVENAVKNLKKANPNLIIGGNLGKNTLTPNERAASDYLKLFRSLYEYVDYFVINVSCPNVVNLRDLQDNGLKEILNTLIEFRRGQNSYRPIMLKISPDLTNEQIDNMIATMIECKIDGIVATNTTTSREGLSASPSQVERIGNGGLSGAPLTKRSLEIIKYIHTKTEGRFPIIGVGGIMTVEDALAMLDAGACLIQVYSGFIYNGPSFVNQICKALKEREQIKKYQK
jgi:dihydroorotate dehydrogenase